ncbi:MAG: hypothetical protein ACYC3A_00005, partial [Halothiobacillus sp.]
VERPSWVTPPTAGIVVDDRPKEASGNKQRPAPQIDAIIRDFTPNNIYILISIIFIIFYLI